jgi:hypothetical protein
LASPLATFWVGLPFKRSSLSGSIGSALKSQAPLTYRGASLALVLECAIVIAVLVIAIMGSLLPKSLMFARLTPSSSFITGIWLTGVWLLKKARSDLPWQDKGRAPDRDVPPDNGSIEDGKQQSSQKMVDICVQYLLEQNSATQSVHLALEAAYALQMACFYSTRYCTSE